VIDMTELLCESCSTRWKKVPMNERGFERTDGGLRQVYVCPVCKDVKYVEVQEEQ